MQRRSALALLLALGVTEIACTDEPSDAAGSGSSSGESSGADDLGPIDESTSSTTSSSVDDGSSTGASSGDGGGPVQPSDPLHEVWTHTSSGGSLQTLCLLPDDSIVMAGSRTNSLDNGPAYIERVSVDGESLWRTSFAEDSAHFIFEVACASDSTVYAVGLVGTDFFQSSAWIARIDVHSGAVVWSSALSDPLGAGYFDAAFADGDGVFVAGHRDGATIEHYSPEGELDWEYAGLPAEPFAIVRRDDTLFVAGTHEDFPADPVAWLGAISLLDDELVWDERIDTRPTAAYQIIADPTGDGVLFAGDVTFEVDFGGDDESVWVWPCNADGCDGQPRQFPRLGELEGFAVAATGEWLGLASGRIVARASDGDSAWQHLTELSQNFDSQPNALAVDSTGAILVGGTFDFDGPPTLVKLAIEQ